MVAVPFTQIVVEIGGALLTLMPKLATNSTTRVRFRLVPVPHTLGTLRQSGLGSVAQLRGRDSDHMRPF